MMPWEEAAQEKTALKPWEEAAQTKPVTANQEPGFLQRFGEIVAGKEAADMPASGVLGNLKKDALMILGALSLPARALGAATQGYDIADPKSNIFRPGMDYLENKMEGPGILPAIGRGATELVGGALGDPTALVAMGPITKVAGKAIEGTGNAMANTGEKMITSYLKPLQKNFKDGYDPETVFKEGLVGSSASEIAANTESKIQQLAEQQHALIQEGKEAGAHIHLEDSIDQAIKPIIENKAKYGSMFTGKLPANIDDLSGAERDAALLQNTPFQKAVDDIRGVIYRVTNGDPMPDLETAQKIKQQIGELGAWAHDPMNRNADLSALETVANKVYMEMKQRIEDSTPEGLKEINQRISALIPVKNAAIRGATREERNNIMGLPEMIGIGGALAAGDIRPLAVPIMNKVLRNPVVAQGAYKLGNLTSDIGAAIAGMGESRNALPVMGNALIRNKTVPVPEATVLNNWEPRFNPFGKYYGNTRIPVADLKLYEGI